jgi:TolB-like protein/DNA-binding winged helix-turn-helix (wHTH) protein/Tfp pilus assembly protein PilF
MNSAKTVILIRFGSFELNLDRRELRRSGRRLPIDDEQFRVLMKLLEEPGEIVARDQLQQNVGQTNRPLDLEAATRKTISRLREVLGDRADSPRFIENILGKGYRFIAAVNCVPRENRTPEKAPDQPGAPVPEVPVVDEPPPVASQPAEVAQGGASQVVTTQVVTSDAAKPGQDAGLSQDNPAQGTQAQGQPAVKPDGKLEAKLKQLELIVRRYRKRQPGRGKLAWVAWPIAAVLLAGAGAWVWKSGGFPQPAVQSIAVLPLRNRSGDPAQDYLSDGMTEQLIADLTQIHSLRIISPGSANRIRDAKKSLAEIARELHVEAIVEGSFARSGERILVTTKLLDARPARRTWVENFDHQMTDLDAMEREIAEAIAGHMGAKLAGAKEPGSSPTRQSNPRDHEALLKGRYFANKRTAPDTRKAIGYFNEAIMADPSDADAWAGLAECYASLGADLGVSPPGGVYPFAKAAVERALALNPKLSEAHLTAASLKLWYECDWTGAESEFLSAIHLNPNDSAAHRGYSRYLSLTKRFDEALAENQRAIALAPTDVLAATHLACIYTDAGEAAKALAQCRKVNEMDAGYTAAYLWAGRAYDEQGQWREARMAFEKATDLHFVPYQVGKARASAAAGDRRGAEAALGRLRDWSIHDKAYVSPIAYASIYAALGQDEQTLTWLEKAYDERATGLVAIAAGNTFDSVRNQPRFRALIRKIGPPR